MCIRVRVPAAQLVSYLRTARTATHIGSFSLTAGEGTPSSGGTAATRYQRTFHGHASQVAHVRRDIAAYLDGCPAADDAVLIVSEIVPKSLALPRTVRQVEVTKLGRSRLIAPADQSWDAFFDGPGPSDDFMRRRRQRPPGKRERF